MHRAICFLSFALLLVSPALGNDWTRFRGDGGSGTVPSLSHPKTWGAEENVSWTTDIPGGGWSSPIVVGERIYLTTADHPDYDGPVGFRGGVSRMRETGGKPEGDMTFQVHCLSLADGSKLWSKDAVVGEPPYGVHPSNTFATESPASDGERLFVYFGMIGKAMALDLATGKEIWRFDVGAYPTGNGFGTGSSIATHGGRVFVQCDNDRESFLVALAATDGRELWRADRRKGTSWATPVVWSADGNDQLISCGPDTVTAYDPASGDVQWELTGMGGSFSSSPVFDDDRLYFGNSGPRSRGPLVAVKAGSQGPHKLGREDSQAVAWNQKGAGPGFASPVTHDGRVYVAGSPGVLACHDAETGEILWRERLPGAGSIVSSPWLCGDTMFIQDENGKTFVVKVGAEYELLGTNELPGLYWSTPSVAGNALLVREATKLHCIRAEADRKRRGI